MKKIVSIIVALVLVCTMTFALAAGTVNKVGNLTITSPDGVTADENATGDGTIAYYPADLAYMWGIQAMSYDEAGISGLGLSEYEIVTGVAQAMGATSANITTIDMGAGKTAAIFPYTTSDGTLGAELMIADGQYVYMSTLFVNNAGDDPQQIIIDTILPWLSF